MVLEDREYMRPNYGGPSGGLKVGASPVVLLIIVNVVLYIIDRSSGGALTNRLALRSPQWTHVGSIVNTAIGLFSYQFLHDLREIDHILWNMLFLFMMGRCIEDELTKYEYLRLYLVAGAVGGLAWLIFDGRTGLVGASASLYGILFATTLLSPNQTVLIMFVFPMRLKWATLLMMAVAPFLMGENVSHIAHMGGALGGYLVILIFHKHLIRLRWGELVDFGRGGKRSEKRRRKGKKPIPFPRRRPSEDDDQEASTESDPFLSIDPILDKIGKHGMKSLTRKEKQLLDRARKKLK